MDLLFIYINQYMISLFFLADAEFNRKKFKALREKYQHYNKNPKNA